MSLFYHYKAVCISVRFIEILTQKNIATFTRLLWNWYRMCTYTMGLRYISEGHTIFAEPAPTLKIIWRKVDSVLDHNIDLILTWHFIRSAFMVSTCSLLVRFSNISHTMLSFSSNVFILILTEICFITCLHEAVGRRAHWPLVGQKGQKSRINRGDTFE